MGKSKKNADKKDFLKDLKTTNIKFIDSHSHLYSEEFDEDRTETMNRALKSGVGKIFFPNINEASLERVHKLCETYPNLCFPMIGLHPTELKGDYVSELNFMKKKLEEPNNPYIGIGEVGLDLYWDDSQREEQIKIFEEQIKWAIEYKLPLMIHSRSAHRLLIDSLTPYKKDLVGGVFHCFEGSVEEATEMISFDNFALGIGGVVTFKRSSLPKVLENIPINRIVLETDAPFLSPVPMRGRRNETSFIPFIVDKLASIYKEDPDLIIKETNKTVARIFPKAFV